MVGCCGGVQLGELHQSSVGDEDQEDPEGGGGPEEEDHQEWSHWQFKSENRFIVKASGLLVLTRFMWSMFLVQTERQVWEDRAVLARLKEKLQTEDGRFVLRIEQGGVEVMCHVASLLHQALPELPWSNSVRSRSGRFTGLGCRKIPHFISSFQNLLVLDLSRNGVTEIPKQIAEEPEEAAAPGPVHERLSPTCRTVWSACQRLSGLTWEETNYSTYLKTYTGVRCWPVDLDVSVLDQQLKLFVSRHSAFLSEHVPGQRTLQHSGDILDVLVVVNPAHDFVCSEVRRLVCDPSRHKLLVLAGQCVEDSGDIVLQRGSFSLDHFIHIFTDERFPVLLLETGFDIWDRIDSVLLTHIGVDNLPGLNSLLLRKVAEHEEESAGPEEDWTKNLIFP
ncbi:Microtubule-associated protein 1B [Nibea albiflora]|nr:Microtubule-associated protein 1B [Nibea albiflora]